MKAALKCVGLWERVAKRGGLDGELTHAGLSGGQKQLFSLARAVLASQQRGKGGGIVLLDKPTSSVDQKTNEVVNRLVKDVFSSYTIITVSHRLETCGDADVLIRMMDGKVAEVGKKGG